MGKTTGFLEYPRKTGAVLAPQLRLQSFNEFHTPLPAADQRLQGARCMDCGVPFCQASLAVAGGSGCPLHNLVPEINDLVYRGHWAEAYQRLSKTHCMPEFTCRVCPALCEAACTCGLGGEAVSTKENERQVIEYAFANGLVTPDAPRQRTGKSVAIVGSGPAGLAAAILLNRRGHSITVYEKSDRPGGLLQYGIPNMKLEKSVVQRRISLMQQAGIQFVCNVTVGRDVSAALLLGQYDRVLLATGASQPRDLDVPNRNARGIEFAVDFLSGVTKQLLDTSFAQPPTALCKGKQVLVIGGGDTGNDCVGTALRLSAAGVTQLEMMPKPPATRAEANPWPQWPRVFQTDYGQQEAIYRFGKDPRVFQTTVTAFQKGKSGRVCGATLVDLQPVTDPETGRTRMQPVAGSQRDIPADLVLIAAGFVGSDAALAEGFGIGLDARGNLATNNSYQTSVPRVFAAGDARRGQSLVVWAIAEGSAAARAVDESLMWYSNL